MKLASNTGMLLLGIWLVLTASIQLLNFNNVPPVIPSVLALAAGVMILMNK